MAQELGASSCVMLLEGRISVLENEKADLEASLAAARLEAETSTKHLEEARKRVWVAEDAAKTAEARR